MYDRQIAAGRHINKFDSQQFFCLSDRWKKRTYSEISDINFLMQEKSEASKFTNIIKKEKTMAKKNTITLPDGTVVSHKKPLKEQMYKYRWFYLMFLPVFIFVVVFYYLPMFGIVYSFTEYKLIKDPVWTGFKNFETLFSKPMFWRAF